MSIERQRKAANELEDLRAPLAEIIRQLRQGVSDPLAYALVYQLRWRMGAVVRNVGVGVPGTRYRVEANELINAQILKAFPHDRG